MIIDKTLKILVADDMPNMRRTIRNMLRSNGYENIVEAQDGDAAYDALKAGGIGLVVSDWNMPGMTGIELLRKTRQDIDLKSVPFLMITAEINEERIAHAAETDVDGYIIKPFNASTLNQKIESIIERKLKPSPIDAIINLSKAMIEANQTKKALEALQQALEKHPDSARLMTAIGEAYEDMAEETVAIEYYLKATRVNALFVRALQRLGDLFVKQNKERKALEYFEQAAKISPRESKRQLAMGKIYLKNGDTDKARNSFNIAQSADDRDPGIHKEIGEAYMDAGLEEYAVQAFRMAIDADPGLTHLYNRLGIALRRKGRYLEAIEEYKIAIELEPEDEVLYFNLSKAYMEAGDRSSATDTITKALEIDPDFDEAKQLLTTLKG